jgi:hypothetical protein
VTVFRFNDCANLKVEAAIARIRRQAEAAGLPDIESVPKAHEVNAM